MKEIVSTITSKGLITIPVEVRPHLGLGPRAKIAFVIEDEGTVQLRPPLPRHRIAAGCRRLPGPPPPVGGGGGVRVAAKFGASREP